MLGYFMTETDVVQNYPTNFEAWIEEFNDWQTRIGFDPSWLGDYRFDIKFDWDTAGGEIEFGDFEGMPKWERRMQIPQQNITDAIITMVSVQGDTDYRLIHAWTPGRPRNSYHQCSWKGEHSGSSPQRSPSFR